MTQTLLTAWKTATAELKAGRIDSPSIDARLLLEVAAGCSRTDILTDPYRVVTPDQQAVLDGYVARRLKREPVSRILGRKGFWKIMPSVFPASSADGWRRALRRPVRSSRSSISAALRSAMESRSFFMLSPRSKSRRAGGAGLLARVLEETLHQADDRLVDGAVHLEDGAH